MWWWCIEQLLGIFEILRLHSAQWVKKKSVAESTFSCKFKKIIYYSSLYERNLVTEGTDLLVEEKTAESGN